MKRVGSLWLAFCLLLGLCACGQATGSTWQEQYDLGIRYLGEGNYEEAILAFEAAIEIEPRNAEAYLSLAELYLDLGDTDAAIAILSDALNRVDDPSAVQSMLDELTEPEAWIYVNVSSQAELDALALREDAKEIATVVGTEDANISDISALAGLTNLTSLHLYKGSISDISALSGLTKLVQLQLADNNVSDLSPLSGLTRLTELYLSRNNITDLSPLSGLTKLENLNLKYNNISDLSPLAGLTNLTHLTLSSNNISDLSPLSGLTGLLRLDLNYNYISDVSALSGMTNLHHLWLHANEPIDITPLNGLAANLETLALGLNTIGDKSALYQQVEDLLFYGNEKGDEHEGR